MDKIKNAKTEYVIISKVNCVYCDMVEELLKDNFIDYTVIKIEKLTPLELIDIKPEEAKKYPFVFKNHNYIGGYNELKKELNN
jgi:glutaredoxin